MATTVNSTAPEQALPCANCAQPLSGRFCGACGQEARNLHRSFYALAAEAVGDVFDVDARWARTIGPLLFRPGEVTRRYRRGHRVAYVPPLKTYLIAALVFFGLFTVFPSRGIDSEAVFMTNSPEARAARERGVNATIELPERIPVFDDAYQRAAANAIANPRAFFSAVYGSIPRVFFALLPLFALYLELFYRKEGYYVEHLVFSLYYHAFVFATLSILFLVGHADAWLPRWIRFPIGFAGWAWIAVHLPIALQRVYGGPKWKTGLKVVGLWTLYLLSAMMIGMPLMVFLAMLAL